VLRSRSRHPLTGTAPPSLHRTAVDPSPRRRWHSPAHHDHLAVDHTQERGDRGWGRGDAVKVTSRSSVSRLGLRRDHPKNEAAKRSMIERRLRLGGPGRGQCPAHPSVGNSSLQSRSDIGLMAAHRVKSGRPKRVASSVETDYVSERLTAELTRRL
jgi:hypothetical protein